MGKQEKPEKKTGNQGKVALSDLYPKPRLRSHIQKRVLDFSIAAESFPNRRRKQVPHSGLSVPERARDLPRSPALSARRWRQSEGRVSSSRRRRHHNGRRGPPVAPANGSAGAGGGGRGEGCEWPAGGSGANFEGDIKGGRGSFHFLPLIPPLPLLLLLPPLPFQPCSLPAPRSLPATTSSGFRLRRASLL